MSLFNSINQNTLTKIKRLRTFHQSLRVLDKNHALVCNPYDYIGG